METVASEAIEGAPLKVEKRFEARLEETCRECSLAQPGNRVKIAGSAYAWRHDGS